MLIFYGKVAKQLNKVRLLLIVCFWSTLLLAAYLILKADQHAFDLGLLPTLLLIVWLLLSLLLTQLFTALPDFNALPKNRWQKFKLAIARYCYQFIALMFTLVSVAAIFISIRSLRLWLAST